MKSGTTVFRVKIGSIRTHVYCIEKAPNIKVWVGHVTVAKNMLSRVLMNESDTRMIRTKRFKVRGPHNLQQKVHNLEGNKVREP